MIQVLVHVFSTVVRNSSPQSQLERPSPHCMPTLTTGGKGGQYKLGKYLETKRKGISLQATLAVLSMLA